MSIYDANRYRARLIKVETASQLKLWVDLGLCVTRAVYVTLDGIEPIIRPRGDEREHEPLETLKGIMANDGLLTVQFVPLANFDVWGARLTIELPGEPAAIDVGREMVKLGAATLSPERVVKLEIPVNHVTFCGKLS